MISVSLAKSFGETRDWTVLRSRQGQRDRRAQGEPGHRAQRALPDRARW